MLGLVLGEALVHLGELVRAAAASSHTLTDRLNRWNRVEVRTSSRGRSDRAVDWLRDLLAAPVVALNLRLVRLIVVERVLQALLQRLLLAVDLATSDVRLVVAEGRPPVEVRAIHGRAPNIRPIVVHGHIVSVLAHVLPLER